MARPGELAYYAGLSGLPAGASLRAHKLAYFRAQAALPDASMARAELAFYRAQTGLVDASYDRARLAYLQAQVPSITSGSVDRYLTALFAGGGVPPDVTPPTAGTLASSNVTSTTFDLTVSGASDGTALHAQPYRFSTDNGSTWSPYQASPVFNVTGKTASTAYTCVHQTRDAAGNVSTGSSIVVNTSAGASAPLAYRSNGVSGTDGTSYTFAAQAIGAAAANRRAIVAFGYAATGTPLPSSVTIGGVAATLDADSGALVGNRRVAIYSAIVPTGTTADVVLTFPSTVARLGMGLWTIGGNPTGQSNSQPNIDSGTLTVTTVAGDYVVACGYISQTVSLSVNWTGATERFDANVEGTTDDFSGADVQAAGTSTAIGFSTSAVSNQEGFLAAAYRLAA